jgi:hypothetical protein
MGRVIEAKLRCLQTVRQGIDALFPKKIAADFGQVKPARKKNRRGNHHEIVKLQIGDDAS